MTRPSGVALRDAVPVAARAGRILLLAVVLAAAGTAAFAASPGPKDTGPVLTSAPAEVTRATGATFTFTAAGAAGFECALDSGVFTACTSPRTYPGPLAEGGHAFSVRAYDARGKRGPAASWIWRVDTGPPPAPTFTRTPANPTNQTGARLEFTDRESGVRYRCRLDLAAFHDCASPVTYLGPLAEGTHTVAVLAIDAAGNQSAAATYTWRIDRTPPPAPVIASGPATETTDTAATFGFTDAEHEVTFRCRLDSDTVKDCTSPQTYTRLAADRHTFAVAAVDAAGNVSTAPAYTWTVKAPVAGFAVAGNLTRSLYPGATAPLDVTVTNPFAFDIVVRRITVTPRQATVRAGQPNPACDGTDNLVVAQQYSGPAVRVPRRATVSLSGLRVPQAQWPLLRMPNLPVNQDACKSTTFTFGYSAEATR